jgi:anaerobic selenocysteine-containing dehydrogenase
MKTPALKKKIETSTMSRRGFLRWSALVGTAAASTKGLAGGFRRRDPRHALVEQAPSEERMIRTGCPAHNCGGRCLLQVFVRDGRIVRIDTDDRPGTPSPILSCARASVAATEAAKAAVIPTASHPLKR